MTSLKFTLILVLFSLLLNKQIFSQETGTTDQNSSKVSYLENQLYFVEEYTKDGEEVGRSNKFYIKQNGGYITAMLRTVQPIGVNTVDVMLERESSDGSEIIDTQPYDITSSKRYFFFDQIIFYKPGNYKVTVLKADGTIIAIGKVKIEFEN